MSVQKVKEMSGIHKRFEDKNRVKKEYPPLKVVV